MFFLVGLRWTKLFQRLVKKFEIFLTMMDREAIDGGA